MLDLLGLLFAILSTARINGQGIDALQSEVTAETPAGSGK
jgi:hypothetical protein